MDTQHGAEPESAHKLQGIPRFSSWPSQRPAAHEGHGSHGRGLQDRNLRSCNSVPLGKSSLVQHRQTTPHPFKQQQQQHIQPYQHLPQLQDWKQHQARKLQQMQQELSKQAHYQHSGRHDLVQLSGRRASTGTIDEHGGEASFQSHAELQAELAGQGIRYAAALGMHDVLANRIGSGGNRLPR